jgi:hypothetical protein
MKRVRILPPPGRAGRLGAVAASARNTCPRRAGLMEPGATAVIIVKSVLTVTPDVFIIDLRTGAACRASGQTAPRVP